MATPVPVTPEFISLPDGTKLILRPGVPQERTGRRETDARTALTRGLADYLKTLEIDMAAGRHFAFKAVHQTWAEPEEEADYPFVALYAPEKGVYDASKFTPVVNSKDSIPQPDGRYLVSASEYVLDLTLDIWATDPAERMALTAMIEDAMNPALARYGLELELPYYFGERATYEMMSSGYMDDQASAMQRVRKVQFTVRARIAVLRAVPLAKARIQFKLEKLE